MSSDHPPQRPSWDCAGCGQPWPCDPAREYIARQLDEYLVPVYMATRLEEAVVDMPEANPVELHERFVAWTRPRPLPHEPVERAVGRARVPNPGRHRTD